MSKYVIKLGRLNNKNVYLKLPEDKLEKIRNDEPNLKISVTEMIPVDSVDKATRFISASEAGRYHSQVGLKGRRGQIQTAPEDKR